MFGHNDNNQQRNDPMAAHDDITAAADALATSLDSSSQNGSGGGTLGSFMPGAPQTPAPVPLGAPDTPEPPVPTENANNTNTTADIIADIPSNSTPARPVIDGADANGLLDIKQQALHALTPLVSQLDQTPEERFRTTMMMIQASDNHSLLKDAYDAAQKMSNEKERAQALLDIVNEINYFTQQS